MNFAGARMLKGWCCRLGSVLVLVAGMALAPQSEAVAQSRLSEQDYQSALDAYQYEEWSVIERLSRDHSRAGCVLDDAPCHHLLLMRADYFFVGDQFEQGDAILARFRGLAFDRMPGEVARVVREQLAITEAVALRQKGQRTSSQQKLVSLNQQALSPAVKARVMGELAYVTLQRDDTAQAQAIYEELLKSAKARGDRGFETFAEVGLALTAKALSQYGAAVRRFDELVLKMSGPEYQRFTRRLSFVHGNLGALKKQMGDYKGALQEYTLARQLALSVDPVLYSSAYIDMIASAHRLLGDPQRAQRMLTEEFLPAMTIPARRYLAMKEIALCQVAAGQWQSAHTLLQEAIRLRLGAGIRGNIGAYYADLGVVELKQGQVAQASDSFFEGLWWAEQQKDQESLWKLSAGLSRLYLQTGNRAASIFWAKRSVNSLQQIRSGLSVSLDHSAQSVYATHVGQIYQDLASLLIADGRLAEAEQVLMMLKVRELDDFSPPQRSREDSMQVSLLPAEHEPADELLKMVQKARDFAAQLQAEARRRNTGSLSAADAEEIRRQEDLRRPMLAQWRAGFERWAAALAAKMGRAAPDDSAPENTGTGLMKRGRVLSAALAGSRQSAVALHYAVGEESLGIIFTDGTLTTGRSVAVSRVRLNTLITELRVAILNRGDFRPSARELHKLLIEPVLGALHTSQTKLLVLSTTDKLRYLPFAALLDNEGKFLIEHFAVSSYALGQGSDVRAPGQWTIAALGVSAAGQIQASRFPALPAVRGEIDSVLSGMGTAVGGTAVAGPEAYLDEAFSRSNLLRVLDKPHSVVHIASHFKFEPGNRSQSVLLLGSKRGSDNESISLEEIEEIDFGRVDQVTLSACDTSFGDGRSEHGTEVESMASIILQRRARTVLATLWKVADASTAQLMGQYYLLRRSGGPELSNAEALRTAQLALIRRARGDTSADLRGATLRDVPSGGNPTGSAPGWSHPFYWAPFVLAGNWN